MITISDQLFLTLGFPLDPKLSNIVLDGSTVKIETISEYLTRVDLNSRYLGLEVNILSPAGEYDINFFITNCQNNSFSVSKYKFEQNISDSGFILFSSGSSGGHIIKDESQSYQNRPNLTFKGALEVSDNELENSTNITLNVDSELLSDSVNPVQNDVLTAIFNNIQNQLSELNILNIIGIVTSFNSNSNWSFDLGDTLICTVANEIGIQSETQIELIINVTEPCYITRIGSGYTLLDFDIKPIYANIPASSVILENTNSVESEINSINQDISSINQDISELEQIKQSISTGYISGLQLSINSLDNSKFDISLGSYIVTDYTNILNPISELKNFVGITGVTPTFLTTKNITYIALDTNGVVVQSDEPFTCQQRRLYCLVGAIIHSNKVNINVVNQIKNTVISDTSQLHDLISFIGAINEGNIYSPNGANLLINKSFGRVFKLGINSDINSPHVISLAEQLGLTFRYRLQDGTEYPDTQNIDPTQYDNNGVLTPVSNNKFTIQVISLFQSNLTRIQYGQKVYDSIDDAKLGLTVDSFIFEDNISQNAVLRCYLIMKKEVVDLQAALSTGDAIFIPVSKFGEILGVGGTSSSGGGAAETEINPASVWDGTSFAIPLTTASLFKRTINNGVTTLTFSLLFADDSASKSRQITVIADNSANASAISSIVFNGGTWNWDVGVLPSGLAAGAVATLELYNESDSAVKPNWTVKA